MKIHPTAIVDASAKVPESCSIGPYCIVDAGVELGEHCELISHVVIGGPSRFGSYNKIYPFAALGMDPQDITYRGEPTRLEVGDHNVIREYVTITRGTAKGGGVTRVGSHSLIMAYAHIGHDCVIGDHSMLVNAATLAGHVTVEANEKRDLSAAATAIQIVRLLFVTLRSENPRPVQGLAASHCVEKLRLTFEGRTVQMDPRRHHVIHDAEYG